MAGIDRLVTGSMVDCPVEAVFFPPVMARWVFEKTDYLKSFPDLMGSVHTFRGTDRDHAKLIGLVDDGGDWAQALVPAEVVLCSATCHPVYPMCSGAVFPTAAGASRSTGTASAVNQYRPEPDAGLPTPITQQRRQSRRLLWSKCNRVRNCPVWIFNWPV